MKFRLTGRLFAVVALVIAVAWMFIVSMWFLIGLIGIALLIFIAFVYGVTSLF
jgi:hypothetical protein